MFIRVLKHELKSIIRDQMYIFFMVYPVILVLISFWLIPYLENEAGILIANIVTLVFILMTAFIYGAVTGFTLLDDQDDQVLYSLRITPIKVTYYIAIKLMISYLFGFIATMLVLLVSDFLEASILDFIMIAALSSLQAPLIALFVNAFASNKVEGFVVMKGSGIILLIPIAVLFMNHWTEFFLSIIPGFWVSRMISISLLPTSTFILPSYLYFILGFVVNLAIIYALFKYYKKRIHIN